MGSRFPAAFEPKLLLSTTGVVEAAAGIGLLVAPASVVQLLLGELPSSSAGVTVARMAGGALAALGLACWVARGELVGRSVYGLIAAMCLYNVATVATIVYGRVSLSLSGIGFWPVTLLHTGLAAWCAACLSWPTKREAR